MYMPEDQITVGQAVSYQLDNLDTDCCQGRGKVKQIIGDVVAIKPTGNSGLDEIHRVKVGRKLMLNKP